MNQFIQKKLPACLQRPYVIRTHPRLLPFTLLVAMDVNIMNTNIILKFNSGAMGKNFTHLWIKMMPQLSSWKCLAYCAKFHEHLVDLCNGGTPLLLPLTAIQQSGSLMHCLDSGRKFEMFPAVPPDQKQHAVEGKVVEEARRMRVGRRWNDAMVVEGTGQWQGRGWTYWIPEWGGFSSTCQILTLRNNLIAWVHVDLHQLFS